MKTRTRCKLTQLSTLLSCQSAIMDIETSLTVDPDCSVRNMSKKTKGQLKEISKQAGRLFSQRKSFQA